MIHCKKCEVASICQECYSNLDDISQHFVLQGNICTCSIDYYFDENENKCLLID